MVTEESREEPPVRCRVALVEDRELRIGAHDWTIVVGHGHSPEHACLHSPALRLLISGDQVLPRISSNVSVLVKAKYEPSSRR